MSGVLKKIIDAQTLRSLVSTGAINKEGIRLFDCTFFPTQPPDWKLFRDASYGKFPQLMEAGSRAYTTYAGAHIPGAVHCNLGIATYPTKYERFAFYPPEVFEQYIQLLGVHKGEHIIVYGRGWQGGMLMSSKIAWMLKSYGQDKVSLVDGGLDVWHRDEYELSNQPPQLEKGDWTAVDRISEYNISFEQLEEKDEEGRMFIDKTDQTRFIDTRPRGQFEGTEDTGLDPYLVPASHIPGFTNVPAAELLTTKGTLKGAEEIRRLFPAGASPMVTVCNFGLAASLAAYVVDAADESARPRVYTGSLKEMEKRDPKRISAGKRVFPDE